MKEYITNGCHLYEILETVTNLVTEEVSGCQGPEGLMVGGTREPFGMMEMFPIPHNYTYLSKPILLYT